MTHPSTIARHGLPASSPQARQGTVIAFVPKLDIDHRPPRFFGAPDEDGGKTWDDRVSESLERAVRVVPVRFFLNLGCGRLDGAANSHSTGYPWSQRLKSGFNWARLAVGTGEPDESSPRIKRACSRTIRERCRLIVRPPATRVIDGPRRSLCIGVAHAAALAAPMSVRFELPWP